MTRPRSTSPGKSNETHAARVTAAKARLDAAGRALRDEQKIALELPGTRVPAGRTLFDGEGLQVRHSQRAVFADGGVQLTIRGPERIALMAPASPPS